MAILARNSLAFWLQPPLIVLSGLSVWNHAVDNRLRVVQVLDYMFAVGIAFTMCLQLLFIEQLREQKDLLEYRVFWTTTAMSGVIITTRIHNWHDAVHVFMHALCSVSGIMYLNLVQCSNYDFPYVLW